MTSGHKASFLYDDKEPFTPTVLGFDSWAQVLFSFLCDDSDGDDDVVDDAAADDDGDDDDDRDDDNYNGDAAGGGGDVFL